MFHTIKQLEERNVASEINCMVWSNRMDLVALSNIKGEVALHRLTWTRAWILSPPKDGVTVNGIAWRPDGKVLAIAYSHGSVLLINIETKSVVISFEVAGEVSFISWIQEKPENKPKDVFKLSEDESELLKYMDLSKPYLRDPPPVSHLEGAINFEDIKGLSSFLQEQLEFNLLVIGTRQGALTLRALGCWKCLELDIGKYVHSKCSIRNVHFVEDLSKMFVTVADEKHNVNVVAFDAGIFKSHSVELYQVTMKYIKLYELLLYLGKILTSITETWESILLEIDKKLSKYAGQVPEGGVTADFLDLLMFGVCTEKMEEFLIRDLTKKGLEKFGQTMELSYSNIQTYLFRHIVKFSQNATYHLADLKGMAEFDERYGVLGLREPPIRRALRASGAFAIKAGEMQQIINHSVINYKAFFRWLYASIVHLTDEPIPSDVQKTTQQDLARVADFLRNFDGYGGRGGVGPAAAAANNNNNKFVMERLGQYLVDAPLAIRPDMSGNDWSGFLEENACLRGHARVLAHHADRSLVRAFDALKGDVGLVFESPPSPSPSPSPSEAIAARVVAERAFGAFDFGPGEAAASAVDLGDGASVFAFPRPRRRLLSLLRIDVGDARYRARRGDFFFGAGADGAPLDVVDAAFYSAAVLSVLLQEGGGGARRGLVFQFPLAPALDRMRDVVDVGSGREPDACDASRLGGGAFANVGMPAAAFSVSGGRRVAIVLAENRRKVKLFEMECEDDEEEEEEEEPEEADAEMAAKDDAGAAGGVPAN